LATPGSEHLCLGSARKESAEDLPIIYLLTFAAAFFFFKRAFSLRRAFALLTFGVLLLSPRPIQSPLISI
jgi:hypothetical protein